MTRLLKYEDGQSLQIIHQKALSELIPYFGEDIQMFSIIKTFVSRKWAGENSYGLSFEGQENDPGWAPDFIEDESLFSPVKDHVDNWKEVLTGVRAKE